MNLLVKFHGGDTGVDTLDDFLCNKWRFDMLFWGESRSTKTGEASVSSVISEFQESVELKVYLNNFVLRCLFCGCYYRQWGTALAIASTET